MGKFKEEHIDYLNNSLADIDYGTILITVHDGYITQIDTTEKRRFAKKQPTNQKGKTKK